MGINLGQIRLENKFILGSLFFAFLAAILTISSASTPHFADANGAHLGAYRLCADGKGCRNIGTKCNYETVDGKQVYLFPSDCARFNVLRAFLVMGLMVQLPQLFTMVYMCLANKCDQTKLILLALAEGAVASLFFIIAFGSWAQGTPNNRTFRGDSFGLLVSGWLFQTLATIGFFVACRIEGGNLGGFVNKQPTNTAPSGFASGISI